MSTNTPGKARAQWRPFAQGDHLTVVKIMQTRARALRTACGLQGEQTSWDRAAKNPPRCRVCTIVEADPRAVAELEKEGDG